MPARKNQPVSKSLAAIPLKKIPGADGYAALVKAIRFELDSLEVLIRRQTAVGYWRVGQFISQHLLKNQIRAEHGSHFYERLAQDVGRDVSTLQKTVRFFRAYPNPARGPNLTWSHFRVLMSVKDIEERRKLEKQVATQNWDSIALQEHLRKQKRAQPLSPSADTPVPQLKVTRGKVDAYRVVEPAVEGGPLCLDAGFRLHQPFSPGSTPQLKEGDFVGAGPAQVNAFQKVTANDTEIFTYRALVGKIIDGDTFWATILLPFGATIDQKLRLRGIDCPEIDTPEGKAAKRFVEKRLKAVSFIIVKTWKDSTDKYDRYLADVFYDAALPDPAQVAAEGKYLNQELLDARLAVVFVG